MSVCVCVCVRRQTVTDRSASIRSAWHAWTHANIWCPLHRRWAYTVVCLTVKRQSCRRAENDAGGRRSGAGLTKTWRDSENGPSSCPGKTLELVLEQFQYFVCYRTVFGWISSDCSNTKDLPTGLIEGTGRRAIFTIPLCFRETTRCCCMLIFHNFDLLYICCGLYSVAAIHSYRSDTPSSWATFRSTVRRTKMPQKRLISKRSLAYHIIAHCHFRKQWKTTSKR